MPEKNPPAIASIRADGKINGSAMTSHGERAVACFAKGYNCAHFAEAAAEIAARLLAGPLDDKRDEPHGSPAGEPEKNRPPAVADELQGIRL
jgi:hypothetical protein